MLFLEEKKIILETYKNLKLQTKMKFELAHHVYNENRVKKIKSALRQRKGYVTKYRFRICTCG